MQQLLELDEIDNGSTNPGNNGPIKPTGGGGGDPVGGNTKHFVGLLKKPAPQAKLLVRALTDLRILIPPAGDPHRGRLAIYAGTGESAIPLFLSPLDLAQVAGSPNTFKIPSFTSQAAAPLLVEGNTLGIEVHVPNSPLPINVTSVARAAGNPAAASKPRRASAKRAKAKKSKRKAARARR